MLTTYDAIKTGVVKVHGNKYGGGGAKILFILLLKH